MTTEKQFPILLDYRERKTYTGPLSIPWSLIKAHERQALANHGQQTLERLAERGGLDPMEAVAVLQDKSWREFLIDPVCGLTDAQKSAAVARLTELVAQHAAVTP